MGLVGVGRHGLRYARHLATDFPDVRLAGLTRRNFALARVQAEEFHCRAYKNFHELIAAPEIDAIVVVTPPTIHPEIMRAACAAQKPVLFEKPAATCVASGLEMLRSARRADIPAMVAQTLRYNGVVQALLRARERIGAVHALRIGQRFEPSRPGWIEDEQISGGGMLLHTGVHCFDLARLLGGANVTRVSARIGHVGSVHTDNNFAAVLELDGGRILATVAGSRATNSRTAGIEVCGEQGQLIGDHLLNYAFEVHGTTQTPIPLPDPVPTVRETIAAFSHALRSGTPVPIPFEEGLRAVAVVEACYRSASSGLIEQVSAIED